MDAGSNFTNSNGTAAWDSTVTLNGAANLGGTRHPDPQRSRQRSQRRTHQNRCGHAESRRHRRQHLRRPPPPSARARLPSASPPASTPSPATSPSTLEGVSLQADDQIPNAATVTLTTATSKFNINTKSETVANVDMQNASNTTSQGLLTGVGRQTHRSPAPSPTRLATSRSIAPEPETPAHRCEHRHQQRWNLDIRHCRRHPETPRRLRRPHHRQWLHHRRRRTGRHCGQLHQPRWQCHQHRRRHRQHHQRAGQTQPQRHPHLHRRR